MKHTSSNKQDVSLSQFFRNVLITILLLILLFVCTAVYLSYTNKKNEILSQTKITLNDITKEFQSIDKNFSSIYMPIFASKSTYQELYSYFSDNTNHNSSDKSPIEKKAERQKLYNALSQLMSRDTRITWIALYSPLREQNYICTTLSPQLIDMQEDFPFLPELRNKKEQMELYGAKILPGYSSENFTFALCGGVSREMGEGAILVGYQSGLFNQIIQASDDANSVRYTISTVKDVIYDSDGIYPSLKNQSGSIPSTEADPWVYSYSLKFPGRGYTTSFHLSNKNLFLKAHQGTPAILLVGLALSLLAIFFYSLITTRIFRQVEKINFGLQKIGNNNLQYRLPEDQYSGELGSISHSINKMATKLESLIENEYLYRLKQKEAELAELQSKFDPHFLYNSLEIIRGRVYDSGDIETADVIKKLSQIFRSFIGEKRFVTIQDEVAFCHSYFSLIQSADKENIQVSYDVDSNLLYCGIIRNLLQPVIENYVVHGFDIHSHDNRIYIRCNQDGDEHIRIQVIDNGFGISNERLKELAFEIEDEHNNNDNHDYHKQSYGLKNLSKRIQLFYGKDCGLELENNPDTGVCVTLRIRKMSLEQHETHFRSSIQSDLINGIL